MAFSNSILAQRNLRLILQPEEELQIAKSFMDRAADGVFWVAPDARFLYVNDAACCLAGYSREELLSMTMHDVNPDFSASVWSEYWRTIKQQGSLTFESLNRTKEGWSFPVEITLSYLEYQGREYCCIFARDITFRKQAESNLQNANEALECKVQEFLAELRDANDQLCREKASRKRKKAELEKSLSLLHATLKSTAEGIVAVSLSGDIATFNQKFVDMWQVPGSSMTSQECDQRLDFFRNQLKNLELVKANEALQVEIAELKLAEQLARRQTQVLYRTLSALGKEPELDKFLDQVLIAITEQLAVSSCAVWLYDLETETRFLHMICSQGQILTEAQLLGHPNVSKPHAIRQHPLWSTEFRGSHSVIIDDIANHSYLEPQQREYLIALGVKGLLEVPLILDKEVIGCLAAYNTERERFTTAEIELAQALTHQVTLVIQLTRLAEKAKQDVQQSAVLEERNRIAQDLHNSLRHLQEALAPNNAYPFNDALDVAKANRSGAQGYLLQDTPIEEPAEAIRSIHQGYTQFEPGIQDKMIAKVPATEHNKLENPPPGLLKLTAREREVLRMIATGANNREIARALYLSEGTVRNHISNILSRLNVRDRTQAALVANNFSLLAGEP